MKSASQRGLFISFILHAVLFLIICVAFLFNGDHHPKIEKHVFQLQSAPEEKVRPLLKEIAQSVAKVEPIKKQKLERKPEVKPKDKIVQKNTISYEDFVKKQKVSKPNETKEVSKTINAPKIQTKDIKSSLEKKLLLSDAISVNELMEYESYLYALIDSAWEYPESFEGYKNGAIFVFDVDGMGQLVRVRISKTSGSQLFDESVSQALSKINRVKANPHGKTLTFQLTFSKK